MLLKKGDVNDNVKLLQMFLGLTADGIFGSNTEKQVIKWQNANGLRGDGIIGPKTANLMGLIDTDVKTNNNKSNTITINNAILPSNEYFKGPTKKRWIFLHHTAGWDNPYNTINGWRGDAQGKIATEFVIGGQKITDGSDKYDGEIVRSFPNGGYAWHIGVGNTEMHRNSVGIEVCNFGYLTKGYYFKGNIKIQGDPNTFYTYVGTKVHPNQVEILPKAFRGYKYWHKYSDAQIKSLRDLILYIAKRDNIDIKKGLQELINMKNGFDAFNHYNVSDCIKVHGLWSHTNCRRDKFDMFPQPELIEMIKNL